MVVLVIFQRNLFLFFEETYSTLESFSDKKVQTKPDGQALYHKKQKVKVTMIKQFRLAQTIIMYDFGT